MTGLASSDRPADRNGQLHVRWLGRVPYHESAVVQEAMFSRGQHDHLLLLEHDHVFTHGPHADLENNIRIDPSVSGIPLVAVDRGGDVTYHGPGQLTGYPLLTRPGKGSLAHVTAVEDLLIAVLRRCGLSDVGRLSGFPGVWVAPAGPSPAKIAAIGVRLAHGRTKHGFNLNNTNDLSYMREHIVACGIREHGVTSLAEQGIDIAMADLVGIVADEATARLGGGQSTRSDVTDALAPTDLAPFSRGHGAGQPIRLRSRAAQVGLDEGLELSERKPDWLRAPVRHDASVLSMRRMLRELDLVTVCEDAGCPNLSECWSEGTATFMVLGERCTRKCGFCLVDTRRPVEPDTDEPARVAEAVNRLRLDHAVLTMVARDDLADGGMAHVARCVTAIRSARPECRIETLISDVKGDMAALDILVDAGPDIVNHNIETVPRLQRMVRPSAGYARSLAVLAHAGSRGVVTKSSLMVGIGETDDEVDATLIDLATLGVDIVTIGQYLRPTDHHLPVQRWVNPAQFERWAQRGQELGIGHVEASPLTRSSYHAKGAADAVSPVTVTLGARGSV